METALEEDSYSGHVFVSRGRYSDLIKVLWWTGALEAVLQAMQFGRKSEKLDQQMYAIEENICSKPPDERRAARQLHMKPLLDALARWLRAPLPPLPGTPSLTNLVSTEVR